MEHFIRQKNFSKKSSGFVLDIYKKNEALLEDYLTELLWWNSRINLISRNVSRETLRFHIQHSLVISQLGTFRENHLFIDSGTGGGLPGLPLALICSDKKFILNDIVSKKIVAVKQMLSKLNLKNTDTFTGSIADYEWEEDTVIISKHAFKVNDLYKMLKEKPWKSIVLLKGKKELKSELNSIEERLIIDVFDLEKVFQHDFYSGKALVEIKRENKR